MLEKVQIIKEGDIAKFAVIPFAEYLQIRDMLADEDQLADYLDYLHMQKVKTRSSGRIPLADVRQALALD